MAVLYTYKVYQDLYSLKNININSLIYTFSKKECDSLTVIETKTILAGETIYLPLSYTDGKYQVDITDGTSTVHIYDILYYNNLLLYIIDNIEQSVCPCICKECDECKDKDDYKFQFDTIVSTMSFSLVHNKYTSYLEQTASLLNCNLDEAILAFNTDFLLEGNENIKELYLKILSLYYLSYYYVDFGNSTNADETMYINNKYKIAKIFKCISKLGIDMKQFIKEIYNDVNVYYWQLNNPIDTISDVIALITNEYLITKTKDTLSSFETGRYVEYTNIGRIVFAIQKTDFQNYKILNELKNDITSSFDTYYNSSLKLKLYVSKDFQSYSNVFIKIENAVI